MKRLCSWPVALLGIAAVVSLALVVAQFNPYLGDYGDDAEFLILGQSLATGQGYAWINSPEHAPHNRYPPAYPVLLAGALLGSGTQLDAFRAIVPAKVATIATLAGATALCWPIARRRLPPLLASGAVAVFALNPFAIRFASQVMSDIPYLLAELAALAWADRMLVLPPGGSRRGSAPASVWRWRWAVFGALLALGAYMRTVGDATALGALAWAWWKDRRGAANATVAFALLAAPWWVRDVTLAGGWRYLEELRSATYLNPSAGTVDAGGLIERAAGNAAFIVGKPGVLGIAGVVGGAVAVVLLMAGYLRLSRRVGGAAEWVVVPLVLAVLVWPIRTGRYLLPVIPIAGIYATEGARWVATRLPRLRSAAPALVTSGVALFALVEAGWAAREAAANLRALQTGTAPAAYYGSRPDWGHFLDAAAWLRDHAGPDDVALSRRHFALYVYSGHYTDKYRYDTSEEELQYLTAGTQRKYVVEDAFEVLRGDFGPLPIALRARGGDLRLRYETSPPVVRVWELVRPGR